MNKVTKVFGEGRSPVVAVNEVDLQVRKGELLLIMGPSGSGKTTLLTMAGGLLRPTSGSIMMNGIEMVGLSDRALSQMRQEDVGFVFQSFNLLSNLTALENVEVALDLAGKRSSEARERARKLLEDVGLKDRLNHRPRDLSGGEKQRVSIARALANEPDIILADEPTANLDSQKGHEVVELLRKASRELQKTVVVVSHDHRIKELADRVVWLEDGRLRDIEVCRDPVCGMEIDPARAKAVLALQGKTYYFCAEGCRRLFEEDPTRFFSSARQGGPTPG